MWEPPRSIRGRVCLTQSYGGGSLRNRTKAQGLQPLGFGSRHVAVYTEQIG